MSTSLQATPLKRALSARLAALCNAYHRVTMHNTLPCTLNLMDMTTRILFALSFCLFAFTSIGQHDLFLNMTHQFNGDAYDEAATYTNANGDEVDFSRMEYYLCQFVVTHDGGQETALTDTYVLVNAHENGTYALGSWDITSVESISFSVGVDEPNNHDDPSMWAADHPLAPQNPSMHWGWASGYRFVAYEGTGNSNGVEIHALGEDNLFNQSHDVTAEMASGVVALSLFADYAGMFEGINVGNGMIEHSTTGAATTLLENFRDQVFSVDGSVSIEQPDAAIMSMYPNPAQDQIHFANASQHRVELLDLTGRIVGDTGLFSGSTSLPVNELPAGVYLARIEQNGQVLRTERVVVR